MEEKVIVEVSVEETLCKTIKVEVDASFDRDTRMELAEDMVKTQYKNGDIVLTADDYNGVTLCEVHDVETDSYTDWHNL